MVLQRTGQDLGGGGRATVDQNNDGGAFHNVAGFGAEAKPRALDAPLGVNNQPFIQQGVCGFDGCLQYAAGIVANVDNQAIQVAAIFFFQFGQGLAELPSCFGLELGNPHIAVTVFNHPGFNAGYLDDIAGNVDLDRGALAFPHDGQGQYRARFAAHEFHGFLKRHAFDRLFVQFDDQVTCQYAGFVSGGVVNGCNDFYKAVFHTHFNAQTAKLTGGTFFQFLVILGGQVGRVGVQVRQHAFDGAFEEFAV